MSTEVSKTNGKRKKKGTAVLLPIDMAILEILPEEGQMIGYKPIALQVSGILQHPEFRDERGGQISGRLKSMSFQGLVVSQVVLPVQRGLGWQRTKRGKEVLAKVGKGVAV